jgi:ribose transport system substrate-binding protein
MSRRIGLVLAAGLTALVTACGAGERAASVAASGPVNRSGVQKAHDLIDRASIRPTALNVTEPVGKPVPTGKTVDFIGCPVVECNQFADLVKASAEKLGWKLRTLVSDGSPGSSQQAFAQIVRDKPDGAIYVGIDRNVYERYLPQLKANGTWLVSVCSTNDKGNGIDFVICTPDQQRSTGQLMAASVVADSDGKGNVVYVNVPAFANLSKLEEQFLSDMKELCESCGTSTLDIPITALGNGVPQLIVGYLRAHPDVKYVVGAIDSLNLGLPAAMKAAGLKDVKFVGQGGGDATGQAIKTGDQLASVPWPYVETYLAALDSIVRHVAGVEQVPSKVPSFWYLTKDNVGDSEKKISGMIPVVVGSDVMFQQLWGVK